MDVAFTNQVWPSSGSSPLLGKGETKTSWFFTISGTTNVRDKTCSCQGHLGQGHQGDTNLCGAYACPTDEPSLVRGDGGYNQGSFLYFAKACGGWVSAGVNGVGCVDVLCEIDPYYAHPSRRSKRKN